MFFFYACSSPESDGKKAAKPFCDCEQNAIDVRHKEYSKLTQKFDSYNFQTRIAVREKIQEINEQITNQLNECLQKAQDNYRKISGKYVTNYQRNSQFEYAFSGYRKINAVTDKKNEPLVSQINKLMLTVIPAKPNADKIKHDMIGRRITERPNGYRQPGWFWEIKDNEITDVQIISENRQDNDYLFEVRLILQTEGGGAHEAFVNMTYVLRQYDDWTIDFLESKEINIVKTGRFDNCVTIQRKGWSGEWKLEFTNHCDVALVVGGVLLPQYREEWIKFSRRIDANGTNSVGGLFSVSVQDYQIHFIERP